MKQLNDGDCDGKNKAAIESGFSRPTAAGQIDGGRIAEQDAAIQQAKGPVRCRC